MEARVAPLSRMAVRDALGGSGRGLPRIINKTLSPIESELATAEEAVAYGDWLRAKVETSLTNTRLGMTHDKVMAEMDAIIQAAERQLNGPRP